MNKRTMAKFFCLLLALVLVACGTGSGAGNDVSGNNENEANQDTKISVMLVDGAPLLSVAHMLSDDFPEADGLDISFTLTNDVDAMVAALLNQEPDFAIVPVNVAAMMHTNGSGYRLAAVTTWGLMHIVSDRNVITLEDLIGETVVAFGRSGTPGITLRAVLTQNNIDFVEPIGMDFVPEPNKVNIIYLTAASDVRDAIATSMEIGGEPVSFGLLAEPAATAVTGFANNMGRADIAPRINIQTEWARNNDGEIYPQAALVFNERLLADNVDRVNEFIALVERSSVYANSNPEEAGDLAVSLGSIAIPGGVIVDNAYRAGRLPIAFTHAKDARSAVNTFLQTIMEENANLIGGSMPEDSFFYVKE